METVTPETILILLGVAAAFGFFVGLNFRRQPSMKPFSKASILGIKSGEEYTIVMKGVNHNSISLNYIETQILATAANLVISSGGKVQLNSLHRDPPNQSRNELRIISS